MDDRLLDISAKRPGFRLHKLEVYNWGTFDSQDTHVHVIRPNGATTLLIGQNGSGKSTLVDALLTLLVRPAVRNYNMAAGGHKQERDVKTYIKGASGSRSREDGNKPEVVFLRPDNKHYSALLACFRNEAADETITLAEILYLGADGTDEKMYCFATKERSIAADCSRLESMDRLRAEMERRGFKATKNFTEYHGWFSKATGMRPQAMDVFNQTVAVKDIPSLNKFIRDHMLEPKPWKEQIDNLLKHFSQLSDAHASLVRVRKQYELLSPIAETGMKYSRLEEEVTRIQTLCDAIDSFFRQKTLDLLVPHCEQQKERLEAVRDKNNRLKRDMEDVDEEIRQLKNEIEQAGGSRLSTISGLIKVQETQADAKHAVNVRYHEALLAASISRTVGDATTFAAIHEQIAPLEKRLQSQVDDCKNKRDVLVGDRAEVSRRLRTDEEELQAVSQRRSNLPESLARLRRQLCEDLRIPERDIPFAAELIAVKVKERTWESSMELVLRGLGLSLLVPSRYYGQVSGYVNRTRLVDSAGRGQKLVYLRVGERRPNEANPIWHPHSLLRKLEFQPNHPLVPWVRGELEERFDFRCCDTISEFQDAQGLALTAERHVKWGNVRHEKDDRERVADPRHYVLGWDNREKCRRLAQGIVAMRQQTTQFDGAIAKCDEKLAELQACQNAASRILEISDFDAIDEARHRAEIKSLEWERKQIEDGSKAIQAVKKRLDAAQSKREAIDRARRNAILEEGGIKNDVDAAERLIANSRKQIRARKADGSFERHAEIFAAVDVCFVDSPLDAMSLVEREPQFKLTKQAEKDALLAKLKPLDRELCALMGKFLAAYPDEQADLISNVEYLDGFLQLQEQIRREDLPRHEQRFKERLNENVTNEIGILNGLLQSDCGEIREKIELLNVALRPLEYRQGTFMELEPRPVRDPDIAEFRKMLTECLADVFEGTPESDESRYGRIEKLLGRLKDEERWRDRVVDVRRWFDFVAIERDAATSEERNCFQDAAGQSGGEKQKLAFTILVAAIGYQYNIDPTQQVSNHFHFVVVDEMLSKMDDRFAEYGLELFKKFGLQLLIVAPLDAKARVAEPYVGCYAQVLKDDATRQSEVYTMTAREFEGVLAKVNVTATPVGHEVSRKRPR